MSLRARAVSGVKWVSAATALTALLSFAQTAVLSRLLSAQDFGVLAMIWVVIGFVQIFADMGMGNAIIQKQEATSEQLSTVYWATVATGVIMSIVAIGAAPWTANFYKEPLIQSLMPLLSISLMMNSLGQPYQMLAQRELVFGRLAAGDSLAAIASITVASATALSGAGVYSLIYGSIAASCSKSLYLIIMGQRTWRPSLHFRLSDLRGFARFGAYQMGEKVTNYSWNNADYLLIGRYLGAEQLGIYRLAYELVVRPLGVVNPIFNTISYPLFSKRQHDHEALQRGYLELLRIICTITFPLLIGLAVTAPYAIDVVVGSKWAPATPLIRILCIVGALRSLTNPVSGLLLAKGHVHTGFKWNAIQAAVSVTAFVVAAPMGAAAVSWAAVGVMVFIVIAAWKNCYSDSIALPFGDWFSTIAKAALYALIMGVIVALTSLWLPRLPLGNAAILITLVLTGGASYVGLLWMAERSYVRSLASMLLRRG